MFQDQKKRKRINPLSISRKLWETAQSANKWVDRLVGTVHTFQGKEADIVYFVSGTDIATDGAANWSCTKPILLNFAVTRAKKEFYVVGDLERFKSKRYYSDSIQAFEKFADEKVINYQ